MNWEHDPVAADISKVVRSVSETLKRRGWKVERSRSPKSRTRYVRAETNGGKRKLVIRVSDHKANDNVACDYDFTPQFYDQRRFAKSLDKPKRQGRRGFPPGKF